MRKLPLFADSLQPIQRVPGLDQDQGCNRCTLHQYTPAGQRCLNAEGEPGGILVISDYPGEYERKLNRPMAGPAGRWLRELLERVAPDEKVVFTNALGCKPPEGFEDFEPAVEACRPYLAKIIDECQPRMILLMGPYAGLSVLGRTYQPLSVRKGYAWLANSGNAIPVFLLPNPASATRNRLIARAIEEDLKWALSNAQAGELVLSSGVEFHEIQNEADSEEAATVLLESSSMDHLPALDVEASGMNFEPDFRIECIAISNGASTYVWSRKALEDPKMVQPLIALLEAGYFTSWNGLYDFCAIYNDSALTRANGSPVRMRLWSDARLKRKLYESDARASLGIAADLVGMGGHKKEAHDNLKAICLELSKLALSRELTPKGKTRKKPDLTCVRESEVPESWYEYLKHFDEEKFAYRFMNAQIMHRYCARDAYTTWLLEKWSERRMAEVKDCDLGMVWREVTQPAMWAYSEMTLNGIPLNKAKLTMFSQWLDQEMTKLKRELQIEVGIKDWNPKSDDQLRVEMGKRNLKTRRKTDGGKTGNRKMKVDKESLEDFEDDPFIKKVARYRLLHHTQSNFAAGLIPFIRSDGRVHPTYLLDGTGTGRASSSEPNMFNQLKGRDEQAAELGKMLRACYEAPPGWLILEHDQGQIEVRMAAFLSQDKNLLAPLQDPLADFHMVNAKAFARAQGKDPNNVTKMDRDNAKCFHPDTEVLTPSGWKKIVDLQSGEKVAQAIPGREGRAALEWVVPLEVFTKKHPSKKLIRLNNRGIDLRVTPDHRMLQWAPNKDSQHHVVTPSDFGKNNIFAGAGVLDSGDTAPELLLRLAIATQADGSYSSHGAIRFGFTRDRKIQRMRTLLAQAGVEFKESYQQKNGVTAFYIADEQAKKIKEFLTEDKRLPWGLLKLNKLAREAIVEEAALWDGHTHSEGRRYTYTSVHEQNVDVLQAIASTVGRKTTKKQDGVMWSLSVMDRPASRGQNIYKTECEYTNDVACLSVPSTFVLVRDKGIPVITGQTSVFAAFYEIPCELPFLLSVRLDVERSVGEDLTRAMHTSFPDMLAWMHRCYAESWQRGYSITHWKGKPARRRPLWELAKNPPTLKELEEGLIAEKRARRGSGEIVKSRYDTTSARSTYNGDNQGSAVDVITSALWDVHCWLQANTNGGQLFLTIYDSIMTMVRKEGALKTHEAVTRIMTDPTRLAVPMVVEGKWGSSWDKLEKIK